MRVDRMFSLQIKAQLLQNQIDSNIQFTLIIDKSGYLPSLQKCPLKSSRSRLQIIAPASFLFTANSH